MKCENSKYRQTDDGLQSIRKAHVNWAKKSQQNNKNVYWPKQITHEYKHILWYFINLFDKTTTYLDRKHFSLVAVTDVWFKSAFFLKC